MKYLYFPGFNPKNISELDLFVNYFRSQNIDLIAHQWRHWKDASMHWDPKIEIENILSEIDTTETYTIIAKSMGSFVASLLCKKLNCTQIILMGVPFNDLTAEEHKEYENAYKIADCTIIQKINDPHGSLEQVQQIIPKDKAKFIELDGDDHSYPVPEVVYGVLKINNN